MTRNASAPVVSDDPQTERTPRQADAGQLGQGLSALLGTGTVLERTFSTGSLGFFANGKITVDGIRYQVSATITRIGTSTKAKK